MTFSPSLRAGATAAAALAVFGVVAWCYWPATHGIFIWDDTTSLRDGPWLRGEAWKESALHGFAGWTNYFRPIPVLLFAWETHVLGLRPEPMHAVSLVLHFIDTLLVGLLAAALSARWAPRLLAGAAALTAMLFYGLHPALIEPVDWIGCQVELLLVLFVLLGLLAHVVSGRRIVRAVLVSLAFFLAACVKESAIAFPLLLLIFDLAADASPSWRARVQSVWREQRWVYVAVLISGIVYLCLRFWATGPLLSPGAEALFSLSRWQRVCLTYLSYWKLIVWPMTNIGPVHPENAKFFAEISAESFAVDGAAVAIVLLGLYGLHRRLSIGTLILAVSVALVPVLNLIPVPFNEGLYHDRYAAMATAMACALLPSIAGDCHVRWQPARILAPLAAAIWLGFAIAGLRVTVPLWTDEVALWQWSLRQHPDSVTAKDHLLSTYIARNDHEHARVLADALVAENIFCPVCMLNAANLAIAENDLPRAVRALDRLKNTNILAYNSSILGGYVFANGQVLELRGDLVGAETAYRDALTLYPRDGIWRMTLALLLIKLDKIGEARATAEMALSLLPPDERERRRAAFDEALRAAGTP